MSELAAPRPRPGRARSKAAGGTLRIIPLVLAAHGCAAHVPHDLRAAPSATVVTSRDPSRSAISLYRVDAGIIVVDLGWWAAADALVSGLAELDATPADVIAVFLTHAHRDHVGAWRLVRHAPFHIAEAEAGLLFGEMRYEAWVPRWAEKVLPSDLPGRGDLHLRTFASDTTFAFGNDTLRAFLVPGHTPGSTAYLFRGRLHAGDAIAHTRASGYRAALRPYSDDVDDARASLRWLRARLAPLRVDTVCTAHLKCAAATEAFWTDVLASRGGSGEERCGVAVHAAGVTQAVARMTSRNASP